MIHLMKFLLPLEKSMWVKYVIEIYIYKVKKHLGSLGTVVKMMI